jgi:hypothetical protein
MSSQRRSEVADTADARLHDKSRGSFRDVSCECEDEGTIILRGRSSSYYEKQVAQETVRGIDGVTQIVNEIEVTSGGTQMPTARGPSHPVRVRLVSLDTTIPDVEFTLLGATVVIGRAQDADVRIEKDCISRNHCEITSINGTLWVRDLGSTNGLLVNGFHEAQSHLMPGDRLALGETSFRVEYKLHPPKCYEDVLP